MQAERLVANNPSVLTADKVCDLLGLQVSRRIVVFDTG